MFSCMQILRFLRSISSLVLLLASGAVGAWTGEAEPNDSKNTAMSIESGQVIRGNIAAAVSSSNPDHDWYKLDIDATQGLSGIMIRIESDDCQSCKSIHYAVYNENGTLLYSENTEQTVSSQSKGIVQTEHNVTGPTYIKVFANKLVNEYFLTTYVREGNPYVGEDENAGNDTLELVGPANTLPNAKLWRGNISTTSDVDWYKMGGQSGNYALWVEVEGCDKDGFGEVPGCSTLSWGVYDQNGTRLFSYQADSNTSTQAVFSQFGLNTNATYYLKVESTHVFSSIGGNN